MGRGGALGGERSPECAPQPWPHSATPPQAVTDACAPTRHTGTHTRLFPPPSPRQAGKGFHFVSDTDTEVIPKLCQFLYASSPAKIPLSEARRGGARGPGGRRQAQGARRRAPFFYPHGAPPFWLFPVRAYHACPSTAPAPRPALRSW